MSLGSRPCPGRANRRWLHVCAALSLWAMAVGCGQCGVEPAPETTPAPLKPALAFKRVQGEGWSVEVPQDWVKREKGLYIGPDRANVVVSVRDVSLPIVLLPESTREDLRKRHADYEVLSEEKRKVNGLYMFEIQGRYTHGGVPVVQHTAVYEGGTRKYILTLSVVVPDYPYNRPVFARILSTFRGTHTPVPQKPPRAP